jgi:oligopeptide transport system substrate-binding protein
MDDVSTGQRDAGLINSFNNKALGLRLSRRGLLRHGAVLGIGGSVVATLLAACGGSNSTPTAASGGTQSTAASSGGATAASGGSSSTTTTSSSTTTTSSTASAGSSDYQLADDQTLRLPAGEPPTMDPEVTSGGSELFIIFNVFDGLVGVNQDTGKVEPHMAEKFEANADASAYTFHLKDGLKWSDGSALNAHDFEWSWKRVLDPNTKSAYVPALYPIKGVVDAVQNGAPIDSIGVKATDDSTLEVTLEAPTPYFTLLATTWTFYPVPKTVIDKTGEKWTEAENIISTGPYVMKEWKHNESITLAPNPNYWGKQPVVKNVIFSLFQDYESQAIVAYENNELDFCSVPASDFQRVKADPSESKELISLTASYTRFVICDCTNAPTSDVNFRQALSMSVDRKTLADQIRHGQVVVAPTLLPPDMPGYNPDATIGEDLAKAKDLLAKANITDPSSVKLSMVYISTDDYKLDAEYLQQTWNKNLGINITLEPIDNANYNDWRASRETSPYNIYIGNWGSDFEDPSNWYNQNFTHASDHYRSHWNDPDFDAAVAKAATNTNEQERVQEYKDAGMIIAQQSPVIPLYHDVNYYLAKPYVKKLHLQPLLTAVHAAQVEIAKH